MSNKQFVEKKFQEVPGGYYESDFYYTPNGSFWDDEGYYFNREGFDKHGGYYDDDFKYVPGKDWDPVNQCYPSDLDADEYQDFDDDEDDFDTAGYDKYIQEDEELDDYGIEEEIIHNKPQLNDSQVKKEEIKNTTNTNNNSNANSTNQNITGSTITTTSSSDVPKKKNKLGDLFDKKPDISSSVTKKK